MRYNVLLSALFVLVFAGTAMAEMVSVDFCIDYSGWGGCDEQFTSYVELDDEGMTTDMALMEIAFMDATNPPFNDWRNYLWAIYVEGYDGFYLPQVFYQVTRLNVVNGDDVTIMGTGWWWYEYCNAGSTDVGSPTSTGSQGTGTGSGTGSSSGIGTGSTTTGTITSSTGTGSTTTGTLPSGYAQLTIVSNQHQGYVVSVDGVQVGNEGTGSDALDGIYTLNVVGNQQHTIRVDLYQDWRTWTESFRAGGRYRADIDVSGRIVQTA